MSVVCCALSQPAHAASVEVTCPPGAVAIGQGFESAINADVASTPLGAYQVDVTYDPSALIVDAVAGGTTVEFSAAPVVNPDDFNSGTTAIGAFQATSIVAPTGVVNVARITFNPVGMAGAMTAVGIAVTTLSDTDGAAIAATAAGCTLTLATPLPTSTATSSPTTTPTRTPIPLPQVNFGVATGRPGGSACLPTFIAGAAGFTSAITSDLSFDTGALSFAACVINPIGTSGKSVQRTGLGDGMERIAIGGNLTPLPDGLLYTCRFSLAADATGTYPVSHASSASDINGNPIPGVGGTSGVIRITLCPGDCGDDPAVTLGEVIRGVNHFLGQPLCNPQNAGASCPAADIDGNGIVSIGDIAQSANGFLQGCAAP